jgi:hypothetical protein
MSSHELPPELDRWPSDARAILGVDWNVLPRDLKKAYTRLIRTYKPEQFPEHFRRIRNAYEECLRYVGWFQPAQETETSPQESADDGRPVEAATGASEAVEAESHVPQRKSWEQQLADIWEFACQGCEQSAYDQLVELHHFHPGDVGVCVRLYWLLALVPELDPRRAAADWLVEGLVKSDLTGPLRELYRREMQANPGLAQNDSIQRLLDVPCRAGLVIGLVEERWRAVNHAGDPGWLILRDLDALRGRIVAEDEELWLRLLLSALDYLVWTEAEAIRERAKEYRKELEDAVFHHRRLEYELDRMDVSWELARAVGKLWTSDVVSGEFVKLLKAARSQEFPDVRPRLEAYLLQADRSPNKMLVELTVAVKLCSAAATVFGELLDSLERFADVPYDQRSEDHLIPLIAEFVRSTDFRSYDTCRAELLAFCLDQQIAPQYFARMLNTAESLKAADLAERINRDLPLQLVCRAHRVFWA